MPKGPVSKVRGMCSPKGCCYPQSATRALQRWRAPRPLRESSTIRCRNCSDTCPSRRGNPSTIGEQRLRLLLLLPINLSQQSTVAATGRKAIPRRPDRNVRPTGGQAGPPVDTAANDSTRCCTPPLPAACGPTSSPRGGRRMRKLADDDVQQLVRHPDGAADGLAGDEGLQPA